MKIAQPWLDKILRLDQVHVEFRHTGHRHLFLTAQGLPGQAPGSRVAFVHLQGTGR